jgi:hypothetical protein
MRLCARPECWKAATLTVRLHREDGSVTYIRVCEEDAEVLRQMAKSYGVPERHPPTR